MRDTSGLAGAGRAQQRAAPPREGGEVYVALITANVLRLRREWALAETKCGEVLRLDPRNATAHSLMGDLLRDQGRVDDAIEWYKLALDLNPGSDADRRKLEALIDQVFPERPKGACRLLQSVFRRWAKATTEEVRAARPVCPWAMLAAAILGVIMLAAFTAVLIGRRGAPPPTASSLPASAGSFAGGGREEGPGAQPAVQTLTPPEITGDITALETSIFEQLKQRAVQADPNCRVTGVEIDPKDAVVRVLLSMPELWAPKDQRESLLRAAATAALLVANYDTRLASVEVRGLTRPSVGSEQLAMVADGSAEAIRDVDDSEAAKHPSELFYRVWWRSSLAEASAGEAAGEP